MTETPELERGVPVWVWLVVACLAGTSIAGLAMGWSASVHAKDSEQAAISRDQAVERHLSSMDQRLSEAEGTNTKLQNALSTLTGRLKTTQGQFSKAELQNRTVGAEYSKKIDNVQSELATKASADDLKALGGDVNGVKSDLEATKNNLEATKASLGQTRDEFGNLIARNHDEIDQLRRLGERDYFEFTLTGKGNRSKVGQMTVELRSVDPKKNQFTIALYVDDHRLEKNNRSLDEPIYFYRQGSRTPLELVVNNLGKNKISGYLSAPKGESKAVS
jgi:chromosome segregation ATPase